jgi:hypothetical protein
MDLSQFFGMHHIFFNIWICLELRTKIKFKTLYIIYVPSQSAMKCGETPDFQTHHDKPNYHAAG